MHAAYKQLESSRISEHELFGVALQHLKGACKLRNLQDAVQGCGAETTMAVPNMLEIVPAGINKWVGMQLLLQNLGLTAGQLMSCGDGSNDLALVANSGIGVAMRNAVPKVKA